MPKWSEVHWGTVGAVLIALYGAALSTFNYRAQRRRDRRILKVAATIVSVTGRKSPGLMVRVENIGHRTAYIDQIDFLLPRRRGQIARDPRDWVGDPRLPCEIKEGHSFTTVSDVHLFAEDLFRHGYRGLVRLRPRCRQRHDGVFRQTFEIRHQPLATGTIEKPRPARAGTTP
jgi:hypothetical protein